MNKTPEKVSYFENFLPKKRKLGKIKERSAKCSITLGALVKEPYGDS